jgi:hypothetical protein
MPRRVADLDTRGSRPRNLAAGVRQAARKAIRLFGRICRDLRYGQRPNDFWLLITEIRNGALHGVTATRPEADWEPLIGTPNHPRR